MYTSINRIIGVTLKLMCAIAVIFTSFTVETSAASAPKKRKAKTTKVKNVKMRHQKVKEDDRMIAVVDEDRSTDDIALEIINDEQLGSDEILTTAAHMPSFPGGDAGLMEFLRNIIRYPQAAADNYIEGRVIVQFVVTKTGKVGEVKVVRSVDPDLDREAVRVCKALPDFTPGRNAMGDLVNVWYTLPITFKLNSNDVEQYIATVQELAQGGNAQAQYELGWRYCVGMGVEKDLHVGMSWLKEAAQQGHSDAKQLLDMILKEADE